MDAHAIFDLAHDILHRTEQSADEDSAARADRLELRRLAIQTMNEIGQAHAFGMTYETVSPQLLEPVLHLNAAHPSAVCPICQPSKSVRPSGGTPD